jgi:hypothetical protein
LGNNVSVGIKNTAVRLGKGKIPIYGRFRHPRYFNSKNILGNTFYPFHLLLESYDEGFSEANLILRTI